MFNSKNGRRIVIILIIIALAITIFLAVAHPEILEEAYHMFMGKPSEAIEEETTVLPYVDGTLTLTMIDCGQADSFLLMQDGKTALVDCGTRSTGEDVVEYLHNQGITKLDYVFGTHPHDDHMGGMYDVITSFDIGTIIIPEVEAGEVTANWYIQLMDEIISDDYDVVYAMPGQEYDLGKAIIDVIGPVSSPNGNLNNYSTVLKISFGTMDVIMTGDAEKIEEQDIITSGVNLEAEILKIGHHGSDTSTSDEFLEMVSPQYALISCKVGNKYNHPTQVTMDKLEDKNIPVYRTDENGTVILIITTDSVTFSCEPGDYLSGPKVEERSGKK